jgi:hypothetical protein
MWVFFYSRTSDKSTNHWWQLFPQFNPFSTEPILQIPLFFTCSNMDALICNYLPDEASGVLKFLTYYELTRRPPSIWPQGSNLRSCTHGQLRLEQAKLAVAWGVVSSNGWKTNVLLISTGLAWVMQGRSDWQ